VSAGTRHTCAIDVNQEAWCWGNNTLGELGLGFYNYDEKDPGVVVPHAVVGGLKFLSIHAAFNSTCGVTTAHEVYCWGSNNASLIPTLSDDWTNVPMRVNVPGPVAAMDTSFSHACAQTTSGELFCWGSNLEGELGAANYPVAPNCRTCPAAPVRMQDQIAALANKVVRLVSTGSHGTCAHTTDDHTTCWGRPNAAFNFVRPLERLTRGFNHYCAAGSGQTLCAGLGMLGDGNTNNSGVPAGPVLVGRPPAYFREVDAGNFATCGLGNDERVYCWGGSHFGMLGQGVATGSYTRPAVLVIP
jgi:alpha-tubulin suppressor-like RCC1 family protein